MRLNAVARWPPIRGRHMPLASPGAYSYLPRHAIRLLATRERPERALEAQFQAWNAGLIAPLGSMAEIHAQREASSVEPSMHRVRAFAFAWLQAHLQDVAAGEGRRAYVAQLYERLRTYEARLQHDEFIEGIEVAKEMLRSNERCCFGP